VWLCQLRINQNRARILILLMEFSSKRLQADWHMRYMCLLLMALHSVTGGNNAMYIVTPLVTLDIPASWDIRRVVSIISRRGLFSGNDFVR
jgi:hypothetical protein